MIDTLIRDLSNSDAYPHDAGAIEVHQTHISVVFLAGDFAYKLKKPLDLEFVDYSTLEKRRRFCQREIELNARLAPDVYLDVVPIYFDASRDAHRIGEADNHESRQVVEWAVRMRRLSEEDTLRTRLHNDGVPPGLFARLGEKLARFHREADHSPEIAGCARYAKVEKNAIDNFRQSRDQVGRTVDSDVFERLQTHTGRHLSSLEPLMSRRADSAIPRDTHGDLRLEHVYIADDGSLFIVDCIEFNDAFRFADPICDIAFLVMDLGFRGFDDEAQRFLSAYFDHSDDDEGRELLDFYVAYRSCVRAKVHGFKSQEPEVPKALREEAREKSQAHWLYALSRLDPDHGPALFLLAGLPATGKSTLGRRWVADDKADLLIETDQVRKELAGLDPDESAQDEFGSGIYTLEFTERTYTEVANRARAALKKGKRVCVAATFVKDKRRLQLIDVARRMGVPVHFIECQISEELAHQRLAARKNDISDADVTVYDKLKEIWERPSPTVARVHQTKDTSG